MKAWKIYNMLEKDFNLANMKDDWSFMQMNKYISLNWQNRFL